MWIMQIDWADGQGATCVANGQYEAYNWFMRMAGREDVKFCKVSKWLGAYMVTVLRYKCYDESDKD